MIRRAKAAATNIGLGIGAVYAFFLFPEIEGLFKVEFIVMLRQGLAIGFAVCLLINPKSLVESGEKFAPRIISILQIIFGSKDKNNEKDNS